MEVTRVGNMDLQNQSAFFSKLPLEVRRIIYACYCDFRVICADGSHDKRITITNALALLSTCRAVHVEIGKSWMRHITLSFDTADIMMCYILIDPPISPRDQLRTIELGGLHMFTNDEVILNRQIERHTAWLSQMRLDMLRITVQWHDIGNLKAALALLHAGRGWRNMEIITTAEMNSLDRRHSNEVEPDEPCPRCIFCCCRCAFEFVTNLESVAKSIAARDGGRAPKVVAYVASNLYQNTIVGRVDREFWAPMLSDGATSTSDEVAHAMLDVVTEQDCVYSFSRGKNANMGGLSEEDPSHYFPDDEEQWLSHRRDHLHLQELDLD